MVQQALDRRAVAAVINDLTNVRHSKTISRIAQASADEENTVSTTDNLVENEEAQIQGTQQESDQLMIETQQRGVLVNLVAGALAGGMAKSIIAPLDRTKIFFQVTKQRYSGARALSFLRDSYNKHGFFSLWRGNSATMARIFPYAAIQFASHEQFKIMLLVDQQNMPNNLALRRFLAGSLAGVTSQLITYPLDIARARMAVTPRDTYSSLREVFVKIWKLEGPLTLYRGLTPTLLGVIPYAGTSFCIYGTLKSYHKETTDRENPNPLERMMFGAVAGLLGQTTSYPLDIVRRRMQTANVTGNGHSYKTVIGSILKVYRDEGLVRGLFKGLSLNWVKGPIAVGISFSTFDYVKQILDPIMR